MKLQAHKMDYRGTGANTGLLMYQCQECPRVIGVEVAPFNVHVFIPGNTDFVHMSDAGPIAGSLDAHSAKMAEVTDADRAWLNELKIAI